MLDLCLLGTGGMMPLPGRWLTALMTRYNGKGLLIDCGEGTQMQMRKLKLSFQKIEHICLSHIHGDHIFGLFGFLSTLGLLGRTAPLYIYAPKNFAPVLEFFKTHFGQGLLFEINYVALEMTQPELVYENRTTELLAFPLNHRLETYGFLIREKMPQYNVKKEAIAKYGLTLAEIGTLKRGEDVVREDMVITNEEAAYIPYEPRSYAYCSDTAPFPELAEWVKGVTLLYHEATFPDSMSEMAAKTFHSTTLQAARTALDAGAKRLLVGHYSSRFPDVSFFLEELRTIFPATDLAHDLDIIEVER